MHQICEKSSPQMWANHVLHMRAILSRLITFCSPYQIFQQMHPLCKQLGRKSEQETSNQMMHIDIRQSRRNYLRLIRWPGPTIYHQGCSHFEEYIISDVLTLKGAGRQTIDTRSTFGEPLKSLGYNGLNANGDFSTFEPLYPKVFYI